MSLRLRVYPDPCLMLPSREVKRGEDLHSLIRGMVRICRGRNGLGIAAPQVGDNRRVIVLDPSAGEDVTAITVMINPTVVKTKGGMSRAEEGCLSLPGLTGFVERPNKAVLRGLGQNGNVIVWKLSQMRARAALHEVDHLDGILFTEHLRGDEKKKADIIMKDLRRRKG